MPVFDNFMYCAVMDLAAC